MNKLGLEFVSFDLGHFNGLREEIGKQMSERKPGLADLLT